VRNKSGGIGNGYRQGLFRVSVKALLLHQNQQAGSVFFNQAKNILIIFVAAKSVLEGK
jgi:ATP-binding cassette, subfamily B, bacterial